VGGVLSAGAIAGFVSGLLNLLILGSLLSEPPSAGGSAPAPNAGLMAAGFLGASTAAGAAFAMLGLAVLPRRWWLGASTDRWHARLAVLASLGVAPVLLTGGLVTSHEAGLAVPDWPNSYTANMFLYPLSKMTGGIYYEHMHRLFGALAGLGVLMLFVASVARLFTGRRSSANGAEACAAAGTPPLRRGRAAWLSAAALVLITVQGLLGGLRVIAADGATDQQQWKDQARETVYTGQAESANFALTVDNTTSINLALAHGVSGQLTFAFVVIVAAMLSPRWTRAVAQARRLRGPRGGATGEGWRDAACGDAERRGAHAGDAARSVLPRDAFLRAASLVLFVTAVLQLVLGAAVRHHESVLVLFVHITMGSLLVLFSALAIFRVLAKHAHEATLRRTSKSLLVVVLLQFALGWVAMFAAVPHYGEAVGSGAGLSTAQPASAVLAATAHQALGAGFLALTALMAVWSLRLTAGRRLAADDTAARSRTKDAGGTRGVSEGTRSVPGGVAPA
jgi:heme A synthase